MKQLDEMPTEGRFVAIWKENGKLMSETRAWFRGTLLALSPIDHSWTNFDSEEYTDEYPEGTKFFIAD